MYRPRITVASYNQDLLSFPKSGADSTQTVTPCGSAIWTCGLQHRCKGERRTLGGICVLTCLRPEVAPTSSSSMDQNCHVAPTSTQGRMESSAPSMSQEEDPVFLAPCLDSRSQHTFPTRSHTHTPSSSGRHSRLHSGIPNQGRKTRLQPPDRRDTSFLLLG